VTNPDLIELAMRMVQGAGAKAADPTSFEPADTEHLDSGKQPEPTQQQPVEVEKPPALPIEPRSAGLAPVAAAKEKKTVNELAAMILDDLSRMEGCPKRGVNVTVYGSNPWNSWLSFGADAGPVRNKADLQDFCEVITERLKRLYDV